MMKSFRLLNAIVSAYSVAAQLKFTNKISCARDFIPHIFWLTSSMRHPVELCGLFFRVKIAKRVYSFP